MSATDGFPSAWAEVNPPEPPAPKRPGKRRRIRLPGLKVKDGKVTVTPAPPPPPGQEKEGRR